MTYEDFEKKWAIAPWCASGIGDGWVPIVDDLFTRLVETGFDIKTCAQIKEKFGGLRVYFDARSDEQNTLTEAAEARAYKTCEQCGEAGSLRREGWWKTLCDGCRK